MFVVYVFIAIALILGLAALYDIYQIKQHRGLRDDSEHYREFINYKD